jgi:hypothetical protein
MTQEFKDLIEQVKQDITDGMPAEAFASLIQGICSRCEREGLVDECPVADILLEALDESIFDAIREAKIINEANQIINKDND